ncbi:MAG: hypothetical protein R3344_11630, partial [Acidobacteriota bacterium]|nr:hypothetical protein [Acidobacteriota bacterium]
RRQVVDNNLVSQLRIDGLDPVALWNALDPETRTEAARGLYGGDPADSDARREADAALAEALRFRLVAIRKLPVEKRVAHLARLSRLESSLVEALLVSLHVARRRPMLIAFLDHLGIPHHDGVIDEQYELTSQDPEDLCKAVARLLEEFPAREVEVYLATLLALDPHTWGGLAPVLQQ